MEGQLRTAPCLILSPSGRLSSKESPHAHRTATRLFRRPRAPRAPTCRLCGIGCRHSGDSSNGYAPTPCDVDCRWFSLGRELPASIRSRVFLRAHHSRDLRSPAASTLDASRANGQLGKWFRHRGPVQRRHNGLGRGVSWLGDRPVGLAAVRERSDSRSESGLPAEWPHAGDLCCDGASLEPTRTVGCGIPRTSLLGGKLPHPQLTARLSGREYVPMQL